MSKEEKRINWRGCANFNGWIRSRGDINKYILSG